MFNVDGFKNETNKDITERILVKGLHSNKTKVWKGFRLWITFWPLPPPFRKGLSVTICVGGGVVISLREANISSLILLLELF